MTMIKTLLTAIAIASSTLQLYANQHLNDTTAVSLELEELEIRSIKQNRNFSQMPLAASTIGQNSMQNSAINGIRDVSAVVPNLYISNYGTKLSSSVYIRGVGSRLNSPSVGLYVDGMPYYEKSSFDFDFGGVESIEVLRGPQGTLYGRNSMGGVINVYTRSPLSYQGSDFLLEGASYGNYRISASHFDLVESGKFGYGISADYRHSDGYFENLFTGSGADKSDQGSARLRLAFRPSDSLTIELQAAIDLVDQLGYPYSVYDINTGTTAPVNYNAPSYYKRSMATAGLSINYKHRNFDLNSQSSYLFVDDDQGVDQDFTTQDLYFAISKQRQGTFSQEINLAGKVGKRYSWLVGAFGFYQKQNNGVDVKYVQQNLFTDKDYELPTYGAAIYHQSTFEDIIAKGLSFTLGIRYDYENSEQDYSYNRTAAGNNQEVETFVNKAKFNQFMPKLSAQYLWGKTNIYAAISRGYKAGGFNTSFADIEQASFDPEYTWNYEIGAKSSTANGKLSGEVALFYIDWKDQQVYQSVTTGVGIMLQNAGRSVSKGIEASVFARPIKSLNLRANYGYTHAQFEDYVKSEEDNFTGNYLPFVPRHTASLSADYTIHTNGYLDNILIGGSYIGQGEIYWNDANSIREGYYGIVNTRVAFALQHCTLELWGRNLTNSNYFAFQFNSFGVDYVQQGLPRTLGATVRVNL